MSLRRIQSGPSSSSHGLSIGSRIQSSPPSSSHRLSIGSRHGANSVAVLVVHQADLKRNVLPRVVTISTSASTRSSTGNLTSTSSLATSSSSRSSSSGTTAKGRIILGFSVFRLLSPHLSQQSPALPSSSTEGISSIPGLLSSRHDDTLGLDFLDSDFLEIKILLFFM